MMDDGRLLLTEMVLTLSFEHSRQRYVPVDRKGCFC